MVDTYASGDRLVGKRISLPDGRSAFIPGSYPLKADGESSSTGGTGTAANQVQGTSASGAADDGSNPVKVGGVYRSAVQSYADGSRSDLQLDQRGTLKTKLMDGNGVSLLTVAPGNGPYNISLIAPLLGVYAQNAVFDGSQSLMQRGEATGTWTKAAPLNGTDRSITASTTSQTLMAANGARTRILIRNDSTIDVWINFGGTAVASAGGGNYKIAANGGSLDLQGTSSAINIIAASGTPAVSAREW